MRYEKFICKTCVCFKKSSSSKELNIGDLSILLQEFVEDIVPHHDSFHHLSPLLFNTRTTLEATAYADGWKNHFLLPLPSAAYQSCWEWGKVKNREWNTIQFVPVFHTSHTPYGGAATDVTCKESLVLVTTLDAVCHIHQRFLCWE